MLIYSLTAKVDRINAGGSVPSWNRRAEWDETDGKKRPVEESVEVTSPTEGSDKRRLGYSSPAACLSMHMLAFSKPRLAARRRRAGLLQGAAAPECLHSADTSAGADCR